MKLVRVTFYKYLAATALPALVAIIIFAGERAQASTIDGVSIDLTAVFDQAPPLPDTTLGPVSNVVGPGIEFENTEVLFAFPGILNADIDLFSNGILFTWKESGVTSVGLFNGYVLTAATGGFSGISSVEIDPLGTSALFVASDITLQGDVISVNGEGLSILAGQTLKLDLQMMAVPLPAGLPLMLTGLLAIGVLRRRKKNA